MNASDCSKVNRILCRCCIHICVGAGTPKQQKTRRVCRCCSLSYAGASIRRRSAKPRRSSASASKV